MEEARKEIDRLGELLPGRPEIVAASAVYYAMIGEGARARELLRSIEGLPESVRPDTQIAGVYARLGDLDATFRWLELSVQARKMGIQFWRLEPKVAHVRSDPRFQVLLKRINLV
jgi:hypothetical protein